MEKVYSADSLVDGQMIADYLNENGIAAELFHQNACGGLGELPVTHPEVWIKSQSDLELARTLVRRCIDSAPDDPGWYCADCEESNPGSFEICWQCGIPQPVETG